MNRVLSHSRSPAPPSNWFMTRREGLKSLGIQDTIATAAILQYTLFCRSFFKVLSRHVSKLLIGTDCTGQSLLVGVVCPLNYIHKVIPFIQPAHDPEFMCTIRESYYLISNKSRLGKTKVLYYSLLSGLSCIITWWLRCQICSKLIWFGWVSKVSYSPKEGSVVSSFTRLLSE